ncbi:MAG: tryptophan--tRNA ligase [Candidatus Babeliales bacterium]
MSSKIVLTGDRPSGSLHLGHYVGSLMNRVDLQNKYKQYVMIADIQALTDNYDNPKKVHDNVYQVMLDYLSVGIDPEKTTIFVQSMIPQIAELATLYMNFVTINRLKRNPTVKTEINQKGYGENVTAGFLTYPVHQAADITVVKADLVPVGEDQLPMLEQCNEIVRAFNRTYNCNVLIETQPLISAIPRLVGTDGKAKMSKSLGNAINLCDSADEVLKKVMSMYTDAGHVRVSDPGKIEGNVVFMYLDLFDPNKQEVAELKAHDQRGGLGDVVLKKRLATALNDIIEPIRTQRKELEKDPIQVMNVLKKGTQKAAEVAEQTMHDVKEVMYLNYF